LVYFGHCCIKFIPRLPKNSVSIKNVAGVIDCDTDETDDTDEKSSKMSSQQHPPTIQQQQSPTIQQSLSFVLDIPRKFQIQRQNSVSIKNVAGVIDCDSDETDEKSPKMSS
jgi:hypothetical protein